MSYTAKLSVVKTIQVRTEVKNELGVVGCAWNKRYRNPSLAAHDYCSVRMTERGQFLRNMGRLQTQAELEYEGRLAERYIRYLIMIFKRLLA